jgi:hypothetical protein
MRHGVRLPADKRDGMARRALELFEAKKRRCDGLLAIAVEFEVSETTARNLVSRGRYLKRNEAHEQASHP